MLISIIGDIRTGKTLLSTIFALNSEKEVYSNYKINIPNYHDLQPNDLLSLPNNIDIFIDEAYAWLESRKSGKDLNIYASNILFQSGKTHTDIYLTIQLFSALDIRFRNMSNILIETSKNNVYKFFQYDIYIRKQGYFIHNKTFILPFNEANEFFNYFDTYQIIESDFKRDFELKTIKRNPKELLKYIKEIADKIKKSLKNNYTHDNIKITMLEHNYPLELEKYVYIYFKKINNK